ncbi:2Fe-2S ferredoxin [Sphingobium sp. SCG-1]|uniref:2Fe-2S iron-sulfur cluster-binding protein n=1 Tax=Sphingobium sp. SCG-1 TaxID=2072936 RepID=UPI000CD6ACD8|nr:2Fe-2S iron-sulfur cluster-binding protein [Sphingobium sp. SCG-1]AUW57138.1 2Fe-2S ferredoxin [Sphingobium sp. SCG-1]
MVNVNFVAADGKTWTVEADEGMSVMKIAMKNNIPGIVADCGGEMSCATCHIYIPELWLDQVGCASRDEVDMLEMAIDPQDNSRLSCQVIVDDSLDGLTVEIPATQF